MEATREQINRRFGPGSLNHKAALALMAAWGKDAQVPADHGTAAYWELTWEEQQQVWRLSEPYDENSWESGSATVSRCVDPIQAVIQGELVSQIKREETFGIRRASELTLGVADEARWPLGDKGRDGWGAS